jgi:DNA polymerase-3 subunit gamma/tau
MSLALYRKYRSRSLDEVVGQDHVTKLLANAIKQGKIAHAYLFTGPRGVGKTSIARILAHQINGLAYDDESTHLDIIEIDAASNNGVDDIRDLRDRVQIAPVSADKKIYIIDEVHMLSKPAFNALLKTLEEPPEHVVFILATTDIDKVPETIISRTQRHTFRRASEGDVIKNLRRIAEQEKVSVDDDALALVARHADGSFRDSVSLFDQLISGNTEATVSSDHVTSSLGLVPATAVAELAQAAVNGNAGAVNATLTKFENDGIPARTTAAQLADYLRRNLHVNTEYARLIDELLDVSRSHYPDLKLLTVLALFGADHGPVKPAPSQPRPTQTSPATTTKQAAAPSPKATTPKKPAEPTSVQPEPPEPKARTKTAPAGEFDWTALLGYVRTHHVAIHSVLAKCEPELDGATLRLYTKSAFYKKKLDDPKYKGLLVDSLTELGYDFDIETVPSAKPLTNDQAAKVAAIMGGGEEVSVEDA